MALRLGLRRASRLFGSDSVLRASSTSANVTKFPSAIPIPRTCFHTSESRLLTSAHTPSDFFQFRSFCSTDSSKSSPSTQATKATRASETEQEESPKPSKRHDLAMLFTCKVCETRSAKTMSRATYETGIVIVRCPQCRNLHLIADRLGWFGEPGSVEDFLEQQEGSVRTGKEESYEFSLEDLAGWSSPSRESKS